MKGVSLMVRHEFQVDPNKIYTDMMHWNNPNSDHRALLVFYFKQPVNDLNRLVVF